MTGGSVQRVHKNAAMLVSEFVVSHRWGVVVWAVAFLVSLHWFATTTHEWIGNGEFHWRQLAGLVPFPAVLSFLIFRARKAASGAVNSNPNPACGCRALVLFLSPDEEALKKLDEIKGGLTEPVVLGQFKGPWRMPLEAIAFHLRRDQAGEKLERIMIIPSADSHRGKGTHEVLDQFIRKVRELMGERGVTIGSLRNLDVKWERGVGFEDPDAMIEALERLYEKLREEGISEKDVLVDVTGGGKTVTAVAAAVALRQYRRFQYVSSNEERTQYVVRTYDLEYEPYAMH